MAKSIKDQEVSPLVREISNLTIRIARRVLVTDKDNIDRLNSALLLANQAQQLAEKSPKESRKMIDLMRRIANIKD